MRKGDIVFMRAEGAGPEGTCQESRFQDQRCKACRKTRSQGCGEDGRGQARSQEDGRQKSSSQARCRQKGAREESRSP